jgi:hypothetical protein
MENNKQLIQVQENMAALSRKVGEIEALFYKNNFGSTQLFNKDTIFSTSLRVPVYSVAPTVAEIGQLISIAGKLYICTNDGPVTWTIVGTQS